MPLIPARGPEFFPDKQARLRRMQSKRRMGVRPLTRDVLFRTACTRAA